MADRYELAGVMKLAAEDHYQIIRDDYRSGEHGDLTGNGDIETLVTGFLAMRIQLRAERKGRVTIVESRWTSGDCPTCLMEYMKFIVKIDGHVVYRTDAAPTSQGAPEGAEELNSIAAFNRWLSGGVA